MTLRGPLARLPLLDLVGAVVAWAAFIALVAVHVGDRRRDRRQESRRRHESVHYLRDHPLHRLVETVQDLGSATCLVTIAVVAAVLLLAHRAWGELVALGVVTVAAGVITVALKITIHHPALGHELGRRAGSFPSGHVGGVVTVLGTILVVALPPRWRLAGYAAAAVLGSAVGLGRVTGGVHTVDDATAGGLLGMALVISAGAALTAAARRRAASPPGP